MTETASHYKMTKLEKFVWNNPHVDFSVLATQTNRTVNTIASAYRRAKKKADTADRANVVRRFESQIPGIVEGGVK